MDRNPIVSTQVGSADFRPGGATVSSHGWSAVEPVDQGGNTHSAPEGRRKAAGLEQTTIAPKDAAVPPPPLPGRIRFGSALPRVPLRSTRGYYPRPLRGRFAGLIGVV